MRCESARLALVRCRCSRFGPDFVVGAAMKRRPTWVPAAGISAPLCSCTTCRLSRVLQKEANPTGSVASKVTATNDEDIARTLDPIRLWSAEVADGDSRLVSGATA